MVAGFYDLPPWEQLPYLQPIKTTNIAFGSVGQQLCPLNNQRIGLIISISGSGTGYINPVSNTAATLGVAINISPGLISFWSNQNPGCPQHDWYIGTGSLSWDVTEILVYDWPKEGSHYLDSIKSPPPQNIQTVLPTKQGVGGLQGVSSYWKALMAKIKGG